MNLKPKAEAKDTVNYRLHLWYYVYSCLPVLYCIAQVLLESGANPDARDCYDNSALLLACETGSYNIAKLLVNSNASVELHHTAGRGTAMHQVFAIVVVVAVCCFENCQRNEKKKLKNK